MCIEYNKNLNLDNELVRSNRSVWLYVLYIHLQRKIIKFLSAVYPLLVLAQAPDRSPYTYIHTITLQLCGGVTQCQLVCPASNPFYRATYSFSDLHPLVFDLTVSFIYPFPFFCIFQSSQDLTVKSQRYISFFYVLPAVIYDDLYR